MILAMIISSVFPVFALIALGVLLRRRGLVDASFLRTGDRLVYYVFFPILLFWKIGGAPAQSAFPWRLWGAGLGTILLMWLVCLLLIAVLRIRPYQAGAFTQATFRFNSFVAIAIVFNVQGDLGVARLGELLGLAIPLCNVLAVMTFIWFSRESVGRRARIVLTLGAIVRNPLILACAAGMIWARLLPAWPAVVDNSLRLGGSLTLPFALISIGGSLTFVGLRERIVPAAVATVLKVAGLPLIGWWLLGLAGVEGPDWLTAMLFFAMPTSTAMYVLTTQLDGDANLSSVIIVLSTLASFVSLSVTLALFA